MYTDYTHPSVIRLQVPYIIAGIISFCVTSTITFTLIYYLYCHSDHCTIPRWFKTPSIASSLCHTASCAVYILFSLRITESMHIKQSDLITQILFASLLSLIFGAKLFMNITFLSRLYLTFIHSIHEMKKCFLRFMIFLLCFYVMTVIWFNSLLFLSWFPPDWYSIFHLNGTDIMPIQFLVIFGLFEVIDLSLNLILVVQFLQKLFSLITDRRRTIIERSRLKTTTKSIGISYKLSIRSTRSSKSPSDANAGMTMNSNPLHRTLSNLSGLGLSSGLSVPPPQSPAVTPDLSRTVSPRYLHQIDDQKEIPPQNVSLFNSIGSQQSSSTPLQKQSQNQLPSILSTSDMVIIDAMTKYTILNVMAILINQVAFTSFTVLGIMYVLNGYYLHEKWMRDHVESVESITRKMTEIVVLCVFPMDAILNCMVLLLHFKFSERMYYRLCEWIHDCVQVKYAWKVERKLKGFGKIKEENRNHHKSTELTSTTTPRAVD